MELLACAGVAAFDATGRLLLVHRTDDETWCLPGGRVEVGESWQQCAEREFREETGYLTTVSGLLGIYSEPAVQTHRYPSGANAQFVGVVFEGAVDGEPVGRPDHEVDDVQRFAEAGLPPNLFAPDRPAVEDAFSAAPRPFLR